MAEEFKTKKAADWLNKNWQGAKKCPICENNNWDISSNLVEIRQFNKGDLVADGLVYPLFSVTCKVCGYTLFINAIVAGFIDNPKKEEKK